MTPYRKPPPDPLVPDVEHPASRAAAITLFVIVVAWLALGDNAATANEAIVGIFVTAVALIAGWRAGKAR